VARSAGAVHLARVDARDPHPRSVSAAEGVAIMDVGDAAGEGARWLFPSCINSRAPVRPHQRHGDEGGSRKGDGEAHQIVKPTSARHSEGSASLCHGQPAEHANGRRSTNRDEVPSSASPALQTNARTAA
jgi:hypothetical protein